MSGIIERLLLFLDSGSEALTAEALVQMKDLLRRYPDVAQVWGSVRICGSNITSFCGHQPWRGGAAQVSVSFHPASCLPPASHAPFPCPFPSAPPPSPFLPFFPFIASVHLDSLLPFRSE